MSKHDQADILIAEHVLGAEDYKARTSIDILIRDTPTMIKRYLEWGEIFDAIPMSSSVSDEEIPDIFDKIEERINEEDHKAHAGCFNLSPCHF